MTRSEREDQDDGLDRAGVEPLVDAIHGGATTEDSDGSDHDLEQSTQGSEQAQIDAVTDDDDADLQERIFAILTPAGGPGSRTRENILLIGVCAVGLTIVLMTVGLIGGEVQATVAVPAVVAMIGTLIGLLRLLGRP